MRGILTHNYLLFSRVSGRILTGIGTGLALWAFSPHPASAMHIAEGILPAGWAIAWWAAAIPVMVFGIRKLTSDVKADRSLLPLIGLAGAAVFLISVFPIPVPVAGTTSHPVGTPLAAILLGPLVAMVLGAIALFFQALFLSHGGLSTLGANIFSMAIIGSLVAIGSFMLFRKMGAGLIAAGFAAGLLGNWATYAVTSVELAAALAAPGGFWPMWGSITAGFAPTQLPLGLMEGIFTAAVVKAIYQRRPELLNRFGGKSRKTEGQPT